MRTVNLNRETASWLTASEWLDGKLRGSIFDGTCHGDGSGGRGQTVPEIMATLTITVTIVEISGSGHDCSRVRRYL